MAVKIQLRNGTAAEWLSADPVLMLGELGIDTTNRQFRVGDGVNSWSDLPVAGKTSGASLDDLDLANYSDILDTISDNTNITLDLEDANAFAVTIDADAATEIDFDNPRSGLHAFRVNLTQHADTPAITWTQTIIWAGDSAPDFGNTGTYGLVFYTVDEGATYYGRLADGVHAGGGGGGGGLFGQIVQTVKTDTYTEAVAAGAISANDITGLTVTITPSVSNSKILISFSVTLSQLGGLILYRKIGSGAATAVITGDAAGNRTRITTEISTPSPSYSDVGHYSYLDSPNTTEDVMYSLRLFSNTAVTIYINRTGADTDNNQHNRSTSTITAMEVLV